MKHFAVAAVLLMGAVGCPSLLAQSGVSAVRIFTEPANATFYVDGQSFLNTATFQWPSSSKHTVTAPSQSQPVLNQQYVFKGWVTNLTQSTPTTIQPITASPGLQWIKLVFEISYRVHVSLVECPDFSQPCPIAGRVEIVELNLVSDRAADLFLLKDSTITVRALPGAGYIFAGWAQVAGSVGRPTSFEFSHIITEPWLLAPTFQPANAVNVAVNIQTVPPRMRILADQTPYSPPVGPGETASLEWGWGTVHTIGTDRVQIENGIAYVFDSWSDGGAINHEITVPSQPGALSFTAKFVPAVFTTFVTSPPGLKLSIDGGPNVPESGIAWAPGTTHKISAPATQTDAQSRKYRFVSWSNGKPAAFDLTAGSNNERLTAVYQAVGQLTVSSMPEGLPLELDGKACTSPCSIEKDTGETVRVSAAVVRKVNDDFRLTFRGWGDSMEPSRQIVLPGDPARYIATYAAQNRLSVSASPAEGAEFTLTPASSDGFYDAGSLVSIAPQIGLGFRFTGWSGDFSGNAAGAALVMDAPRRGVLMLNRVPAIGPAGVRNAAAVTSAHGVAAGSLISIYGANLAPDLAVSPSNPLSQTLANVTVRAGDTFLPLILVSPGQINAQIPANLPEGTHRLTVRWEGKPETAATVEVLRNAPGLFSSGSAAQPFGSFLRADGAAVTPDAPARAGELVSVLGTGFGPYRTIPPDGYVFDEAAGFSLVDPITVVAGDSVLEAIYAGRSGAGAGVDAVQFRVSATLPDSQYLPLKIRVNGRESNTVLLPTTR